MIQTYILDIYLSRHCGEKIKDASEIDSLLVLEHYYNQPGKRYWQLDNDDGNGREGLI